jgi:hypothetical protein
VSKHLTDEPRKHRATGKARERKPGSLRDVATRTDVSHEMIRDVERHVEAGEKYPLLQVSAWRKGQARAIRRCGELLKQVKPATGAHRKRDGADPLSRKSAASSAGLSERQRKDALRVASVPAELVVVAERLAV